uniref:Predicted protein n=1 Tax=Hordeum vulgare subsp. vulgare TaxID=112509 RepID=F2DVG8_HORVV|nr:predicted protein [Hordeum vulgare subsp. vulgare]
MDALAPLLAPIDDLVASSVAASGLAEDQVKYIYCLLFAVPFGWLFRVLPNLPALKHALSIIISIVLCSWTLGQYSWVHAVVSSLVTWLLVRLLPPRHAATAVMCWAMGYMSVSHIYRMYIDYMGWHLDFTTPQMILTIKLTSFAFAYADGNIARKKDLYPEQSRNEVKQLPNLLEFFGFVFFFPSFMAGPTIEFAAYRDYISLDMFKTKECNGQIPSTIFPTFFAIGRAFLMLPLCIYALQMPLNTVLTPEFAAHPLYLRLLLGYVYVNLARQRYYFGWYLAECGFVACGADYNGHNADGSINWDRVRNCYPLSIELASNTKMITDNWNVCTSTWLRMYVYMRLAPFGRSVATIGTYTVSAFWHGFYPGYYIFFVICAFQTLAAQAVRSRIRPLFVTLKENPTTKKMVEIPKQPFKFFYDVCTVIATASITTLNGGSFLLLGWSEAIAFFSVLRWTNIIAVMGTYVVFTYIIPARRSKPPPKTE